MIPPDEARDVPKDAAGKPVDKGEGPVLQALGDIAAVDLALAWGGAPSSTRTGATCSSPGLGR